MNYISKIAVLAVITSIGALKINAQTTQKISGPVQGIRISAGGSFLTPIGDTRSLFDVGYGVSVQADFPIITKQLYLTAASGFEILETKEGVHDNYLTADIKRIPVKLGLKFFPVANLYVQGDAGVSLLTNKSDFVKGNTAAFTFAPQIGYLFEFGSNSNIDISANYQNTDKQYSEGNATDYIGFRLLYSYRF